MHLQESGEMYLESILRLSKEKALVRAIDVGEYMGYSKPSVSRAMGLLRGGGYVQVSPDTGHISLTDAGRAFLREVARGCFAPGGADAKTIATLRSHAAVLQRGHDTGAFAAAAGLAAAALYQEGLR